MSESNEINQKNPVHTLHLLEMEYAQQGKVIVVIASTT